MDLKAIYEVVDLRTVEDPIEGFGSLESVPGGYNLWHGHTVPTFLEWDDDFTDAIVDKEKEGILEIQTPNGRVLFQTLTLQIWEDNYAPNFDKEVDSLGELYAFLSPQVIPI